MKILITTDLFRPAINGVVTSVLNLERELEKNGHEVKILAVSDTCSTYQMENVYYIRSVPAKIYPDVRIPVSRGRAYVQEIIEWNPDVIHSQCEFFSFGFAKRIARKTGAILLHTYHTLYEQYTEYVPFGKNVSREMLGKWMKMRLSCVDAVIAPTKKVERTLREYGLTESEIAVIPSGICLDKFQQPCEEEKIKQLRIKYDIPQEAMVLLSLGRLGFEKRVDELIYGMCHLVKHGENVRLLIVGDGPARASLEELTEKLRLGTYVKFTGMAAPEDIANYYQLGDLFVCASTSETQGLTYIEAMASGLPLVCRKDACLYGVLEEGGNGYSYENLNEFSGIVSRILKEPLWMEKAAEHSRNNARKFGTEQFGNMVLNLYQKEVWRGEYERNESIALCEKREDCVEKWSRTCNVHAKKCS